MFNHMATVQYDSLHIPDSEKNVRHHKTLIKPPGPLAAVPWTAGFRSPIVGALRYLGLYKAAYQMYCQFKEGFILLI